MRRIIYSGACKFAVATIVILATPHELRAAEFSLHCARADVVNPVWDGPLTFRYDGSDHGTLQVGGVFGDFTLPATRAPLQIQPGEMGEAIDGSAAVQVKLPRLDELDACISQGAGKSADDMATVRDQCIQKLSPSSSLVDASARIRIGFTGAKDDSGEDAFVAFRLQYAARSQVSGGVMTVEAFPAHCTLKK